MASSRVRQTWVPSARSRGVGSQATGRWIGRVAHLRKYLHAGTYDTEEEASHARDKVLFKLGREDAFQLPERMVPALLQELEGRSLEQVVKEVKMGVAPNVVGTSKYRGVSLAKRTQKWKASINVGGKNKHCGHFHDEAEAGRAYDRALLLLHGSRVPHGKLNFPLAEYTTGLDAIDLGEVDAQQQLAAQQGEGEEEASSSEEEEEAAPAPVRAAAPAAAPAARGAAPRGISAAASGQPPAGDARLAGSKRLPPAATGVPPPAKRQQQQQRGQAGEGAAGLAAALPAAEPAAQSAADLPSQQQLEAVLAASPDDAISLLRGLGAVLEWADLPGGLQTAVVDTFCSAAEGGGGGALLARMRRSLWGQVKRAFAGGDRAGLRDLAAGLT